MLLNSKLPLRNNVFVDSMSSYYDVEGRKKNKLDQALLNGASICMVLTIISDDMDYVTFLLAHSRWRVRILYGVLYSFGIHWHFYRGPLE
jgi:hypothetical protein